MLKKSLLVALAVSCTLFFSVAWAMDLPRVNQAKIRLSISPGGTKYGELVVENPGPQPRKLKLYLEDWIYAAGGDGTKNFSPPGLTERSCAEWITFSPSEFVLPPYGKQRIGYSVKVPENKEGAYFAAMFFENDAGMIETGTGQVGAGISLVVRIASLFYVEVEGTANRRGFIGDIAATKSAASSPLVMNIDFMNSGNTDITASCTYNLINKSGRVFARGAFNDLYTLPKDKGVFKTVWKDPIPAGTYDLVVTVNLGKAVEEAGTGRGPVITKEARLEIGADGALAAVSELK